MFEKWKSISQSWHFPIICLLCQTKHYARQAICQSCFHQFPKLHAPCPLCAMPNSPDGPCGKCLKHKPITDNIHISYPFTEPLRGLIHTFKYEKGLYLKSFLSQLMLQALQDTQKPECLIPIPLHPKRLQERGFNQSLLLTQHLGRLLSIPIDFKSCKKIKHTVPQATLEAKARQQNLSHTFQTAPLPYQHIALIDDVYTTGSTVKALTKILKTQGIKRVDVWCIARTI